MDKNTLTVIRAFTGQYSTLTIPRILITITGDVEAALFLNQCIYWSERTQREDGFFYKTAADWKRELGLSAFKVSRVRKLLAPFIETELKRAHGAPVVHYRANMEAIASAILTAQEASDFQETAKSDFAETEKSDLQETAKCLTEITTKTTLITIDNEDVINSDVASSNLPTNGVAAAGREEQPKRTRQANPKKSTIPRTVLLPVAEKLAAITLTDFNLNAGLLCRNAKELLKAGYALADLERAYDRPDGVWWRDDWRGQRGFNPTLQQVRMTIGQYAGHLDGSDEEAVPVGEVFNEYGQGGFYL